MLIFFTQFLELSNESVHQIQSSLSRKNREKKVKQGHAVTHPAIVRSNLTTHSLSLTHSLTHSHTHTYSHTHTHTHSHSLTLTHSLTHTLSHTHTHSRVINLVRHVAVGGEAKGPWPLGLLFVQTVARIELLHQLDDLRYNSVVCVLQHKQQPVLHKQPTTTTATKNAWFAQRFGSAQREYKHTRRQNSHKP